ncbi:MAG: hypothetical protein KKE17_14785 [Proteobacteria bacterium]|nr:hypothetical protein [Pseudomonadota bacterium]MBU1711265.1 hypothetical protein [Pseudomonadota bacterium]
MTDPILTNPEKIWSELLFVFQGTLTWKLDNRFSTLLSEIEVQDQGKIREILCRHLMITWDNGNIGNAPEPIKAVNNMLGGLSPGQMLFTSEPDPNHFIYCAWWPWGNGKKISLRIAPSDMKILSQKQNNFIDRLKEKLGL